MRKISEGNDFDSEKEKVAMPNKLISLSVIVAVVLVASLSYAKRKAPSDVSPVVHQGIKYVVVHWRYENGTGQNGGYIEARDEKTGKKVWGLVVYRTEYNDDLVRDVQDVFISSLRLDAKRNCLIVETGRKDLYYVDLSTRKVSKGSGQATKRNI